MNSRCYLRLMNKQPSNLFDRVLLPTLLEKFPKLLCRQVESSIIQTLHSSDSLGGCWEESSIARVCKRTIWWLHFPLPSRFVIPLFDCSQQTFLDMWSCVIPCISDYNSLTSLMIDLSRNFMQWRCVFIFYPFGQIELLLAILCITTSIYLPVFSSIESLSCSATFIFFVRNFYFFRSATFIPHMYSSMQHLNTPRRLR